MKELDNLVKINKVTAPLRKRRGFMLHRLRLVYGNQTYTEASTCSTGQPFRH